MSHRNLATFIRNSEFSTEREKMMEHWLCHKIYEACFARSVRPRSSTRSSMIVVGLIWRWGSKQ